MVVLPAAHKISQKRQMITMTYKLAHAAAWDAADRLQHELSLKAWNAACASRFCETFNRLWPMPEILEQQSNKSKQTI